MASDSEPWTLTREQAAAILGLSLVSVSKMLQEGKLEKHARGQILAASVISMLRDREDQGGDLDGANTRYRLAKAEDAELSLAIRKGEFIEIDKVQREASTACLNLRESICDAIAMLPDQCAGRDVREISATVEKTLTRLLTNFSEQLKKFQAPPEPETQA